MDADVCSNESKLIELMTRGVCQAETAQITTQPSCSLLPNLFSCVINYLCSQDVYCGSQDLYNVLLKNKEIIQILLKLDVNTCNEMVFSSACSEVNIYNCLESKCSATSPSTDPHSCKFYKDTLNCTATKLGSHGYHNCTSTDMLTSLKSSTGILPTDFDINTCSGVFKIRYLDKNRELKSRDPAAAIR
ncbi:uncharacterized protein LOC121383650 [Gigantopelta aegis]|uniref:uncharacterized protein LOC121383650 n=1 Tax=Gigantopelta aegis TaxID=1735272 RepID=UPI001B88C6F4|nr:uncharacterized protein LOC121383650 [Gigantopelta aegis]